MFAALLIDDDLPVAVDSTRLAKVFHFLSDRSIGHQIFRTTYNFSLPSNYSSNSPSALSKMLLSISNIRLAAVLLASSTSLSSAQSLIDSLSFGQNPFSPGSQVIPHYHLSGEGGDPSVFSDRIMLTPPYPGNRRGALWTDSPADRSEWIANLEFRASGPERGGGNLQLWFVKNGEQTVGKSSVYTTGPFDGLVLMLDQYGGRGGGVRGFLNDGSVDYKSHSSVDSLAFGHCDYPYRNLGRFSNLKVHSTNGGLKVTVDEKVCFASDKASGGIST